MHGVVGGVRSVSLSNHAFEERPDRGVAVVSADLWRRGKSRKGPSGSSEVSLGRAGLGGRVGGRGTYTEYD